jgi:hypothetical protein
MFLKQICMLACTASTSKEGGERLIKHGTPPQVRDKLKQRGRSQTKQAKAKLSMFALSACTSSNKSKASFYIQGKKSSYIFYNGRLVIEDIYFLLTKNLLLGQKGRFGSL